MGIWLWLSNAIKSSFNAIMKAKKTIQSFRVVYKSIWDSQYKDTHDISQELENISQKRIDFEHRDKFSQIRNQLIDDFGITWDDSGKMAHDILSKDIVDLDDYELDLRTGYGTP